jgi:hypothetical protein
MSHVPHVPVLFGNTCVPFNTPTKEEKRKPMSRKKIPPPPPEGLVGLFGHTLVPDTQSGRQDGGKEIQFQFQIIRRMDAERWVVQYFSFLDGRPTTVAVYSEAYLLGPDVKLFASENEWRDAHARSNRRLRIAGGHP